MAISVTEALKKHQEINQDALASSFAHKYDPRRGYGPAMHNLLGRVRDGCPWRTEAASLFNGQGSFGNGAAMRVAPLGAYYADDLLTAVLQAKESAMVTHTHWEAVAGTIAVAVATGVGCASPRSAFYS